MQAYFNIKKYIKEAGRKLPIYETMYTESLFELGSGQVLVSRKKPNGDILFSIFMVDIFCLGVKDVKTNLLREEEYEELKSKIESSVAEQISERPNYIFNLIYGAVEYAEDLGFDPPKDFELAEYVLPKVEDVEYEDIPFGREGKPFYIAGPFDKVSKVLATLDKNVGPGNFDFYDPEEDDEEYDEEEYEDDNDENPKSNHDLFYILFPESAEKETRVLTILDDNRNLPKDEYAFLERYCTDKKCDCRHVDIFVLARKMEKIIATINYGWEPLKFYEEWMGSPHKMEEFKGPALKKEGIQSEHSEAALEAFKFILEDQKYVDRLKEHYNMVSKKIGRAGY